MFFFFTVIRIIVPSLESFSCSFDLALLDDVILFFEFIFLFKGTDIAPAKAFQAVKTVNVSDNIVTTDEMLVNQASF